MRRFNILSLVALIGLILSIGLNINGCEGKVIKEKASLEYVKGELEKLVPVELKCDLSSLSEQDKKVLTRLIEAGKIIDELFLVQVYIENPKIQMELYQLNNPDDSYYLELFNIMFGPWNRIDENKPFINNKEKPAGAGFYPEDMKKEEFERYIEENPELADEFKSTFTVIRRRDNKLIAVPYHEEYKDLVQQVSNLLKEAAEITGDTTLEKYLRLRSRDLLTDEYFDSDVAWMDLAGDLEVVIGPYEVYEDNMFGYKAAYEAFICVVDHEESEKLAAVTKFLSEMEANLPIPDGYKYFERGTSSPIKVVNEVFSAGDTKAGVQTTAFNLPNDERVRKVKGSKKVILKNVACAKYEKCWIPIVNTILAKKPLENVSFDAYFNHVLMHEISHGLGPGIIILKDGTETTVSRELKELYPVIEECKADILGIYNLLYLMDKGVFPEDMKYSLFASYLGGMFRSIRFGIEEAHGGAVAIQFNYFMDKGAFFIDENGKLSLDETKMEDVIKELSNKILIIQAEGDYNAAKKFIDESSVMTPLMEKIMDNLKHIPIDIKPIYPGI
jgi:hypothetical protein